MSEKDMFAQRKMGLEEEYFRKKEQELVEQIRRRAAKQDERLELAEAVSASPMSPAVSWESAVKFRKASEWRSIKSSTN